MSQTIELAMASPRRTLFGTRSLKRARPVQSWPMQAGGGFFLICVGVGIILGGSLGGAARVYGLLAGFAAGFAAIPVAILFSRPIFGSPTKAQNAALWASILFEFLAFGVAGRLGYLNFSMASGMEAALLIVAIHFVIMRWSHGPLMLWLAGALCAWILCAALLGFPLGLLLAGDGLIKIIFGALMAVPLLAHFQGDFHVADA